MKEIAFSPQLFYGQSGIEHLNDWMNREMPDSKRFVLVDDNTQLHCLPLVADALGDCTVLQMPAGESSKNFDTALRLIEELGQSGADRDAVLMGLGGGVVSDMAGFVASIYKRGIGLVLLPTSLLCMTDAAHGGKTGVNLHMAKNVMGTFYPAQAICTSFRFLNSLPEEEYLSGMAEVLKHGMIASEHLLELARKHWYRPAEWLSHSIAVKAEIVRQDPLEKGLRQILNFGHTAGHALEAAVHDEGSTISHGRAVAAGMCAALRLSERKTSLNSDFSNYWIDELRGTFSLEGLKKRPFRSLRPWLKFDKKSRGGVLQFVLLSAPGQAVYEQAVEQDELEWAWKSVFNCD